MALRQETTAKDRNTEKRQAQEKTKPASRGEDAQHPSQHGQCTDAGTASSAAKI